MYSVSSAYLNKYSESFCAFLEEKFDVESDDEYDEIDDKINAMEIDGKSEMIEKYEQILIINKKIWKSMFDHVIDKVIDHLSKLLNDEHMVGCKYLGLVGDYHVHHILNIE